MPGRVSYFILKRLISLTKVYRLQFGKDFKYCNATIRVNDTLAMSGDQIAVVDRLVNPEAWVHFGGVPQEHLKGNLYNVGFVGCMDGLKVISGL